MTEADTMTDNSNCDAVAAAGAHASTSSSQAANYKCMQQQAGRQL
jgi:hypothetical protein